MHKLYRVNVYLCREKVFSVAGADMSNARKLLLWAQRHRYVVSAPVVTRVDIASRLHRKAIGHVRTMISAVKG